MLEAAASGILLPPNCGSGPHTSDLKVIWNVNSARHVLELIKATLYSPWPARLQLTIYINSKSGGSTRVCTDPCLSLSWFSFRKRVKLDPSWPMSLGVAISLKVRRGFLSPLPYRGAHKTAYMWETQVGVMCSPRTSDRCDPLLVAMGQTSEAYLTRNAVRTWRDSDSHGSPAEKAKA